MSELEKLYLPSQWSKRYPPEIIVEKHIETITQGNLFLFQKLLII